MAQRSRRKYVAQDLFSDAWIRTPSERARISSVCYTVSMTKLLEEAIARVRSLSEDEQDSAAAELIQYLDEIPTLRDRVAVSDGRDAYKAGGFVSLEQWRHEVGLGDN
jgi:hypothetical protein